MKRALPLVLVAVLMAIAGGGVVLWFRSAPPGRTHSAARRNILLVTIDTLRADRVGRGLTPNIDRLAARGISYPNVRAAVPLTLPSHVSLMSGTIPPVHGVRENGVVYDGRLPTLAKILDESGYRTAAFVGAYVLNRRFGLSAGFDVYDDAVRRDMARAELLEAERPGGEVVDAALAWLKAQPAPGENFFLWVHLYDPHAPYAPPADFLARASGNGYDGEVAYADAQIGRLLDALDALDLTGSTIVALTGDHGESLGEHGEQTHGMLVYDGVLRVPMIVAGDGLEAVSKDRAFPLTAVMPDLLEAAGLSGRAPSGLCGGMFRRRGAAAPQPARCDAYGESNYPRRAGWHALASLADEQWKLISSSAMELYDVRNDPGERTNVAGQHAGVVQAMAGRLAQLRANSRTQAVAPEAAERLRALGYVSGSTSITSDDPQAPNPAAVIAAWTEYEKAFGLLASGDARRALPRLERLAAAHPGAPVFQSTYAQALREAGEPRRAVAVYKAAVSRWPADAAMFHDLAVAAREAGDAAEAMRATQAALALDSNSAMAQNGLGLLHADGGRAAEAAAAFERATRLDPTNASYWTNLGNARSAAGDAAGAEAAYRQALDADAAFADALNGLGTLYVQSRRAADAIPLFERALRSDPALHAARLNLGIAFQESGQPQRAAAVYREILASAPASAVRERQAATALLNSLR